MPVLRKPRHRKRPRDLPLVDLPLVDLPLVGFPPRLHVRVPRFTCDNEDCCRRIFQASLTCAADGAKLTRRVTRWILQRLAVGRLRASATAKALGLGWELVNTIAINAVRDQVYADPGHLDGVRILGVDEHVWKHTRRPGESSSFVTVLVDLTPLVHGRGPACLVDMRPGRSTEVLRTWLAERDRDFRDAVQIVTMDGFAGYATAVDQALPAARKVTNPFGVVHLGYGQAHRLSAAPAAGDLWAARPQGRPTVHAPENAVDQDRLSG